MGAPDRIAYPESAVFKSAYKLTPLPATTIGFVNMAPKTLFRCSIAVTSECGSSTRFCTRRRD